LSLASAVEPGRRIGADSMRRRLAGLHSDGEGVYADPMGDLAV